MNRRQFLATTGLGAIGTSAVLGSGAFSSIAADRHASIAIASDPDAYLRLSPLDTPNSDNYATIDGNGHLAIDIGENPNGGQGVNSNSITVFDGLFEICNQGTAAASVHVEPYENEHVDIYHHDGDIYQQDGDGYHHDGDHQEGAAEHQEGDGFHYDSADRPSLVGAENAITLGVGACIVAGIRTATHGVDATGDEPLFDESVQFVADVDPDPPLDPNPWLEDAQTEVGGLFIHDGSEVVAMEPGDQLPAFGVRIPIYANRSGSPIEVFVDNNDRITQTMRGFEPYDGSAFIDGSRTPWARQPSRSGTPRGGDLYELVAVREGTETDIEVEWQPIGAAAAVDGAGDRSNNRIGNRSVEHGELNENSVYHSLPK